MSIVALGVMPYITASIVVQLATSLSPTLEAIKKEGESGRKKLNQYTRYLTVFLTAVQGYFIAAGLESWGASSGITAVVAPGIIFRVSAVVSLIGRATRPGRGPGQRDVHRSGRLVAAGVGPRPGHPVRVRHDLEHPHLHRVRPITVPENQQIALPAQRGRRGGQPRQSLSGAHGGAEPMRCHGLQGGILNRRTRQSGAAGSVNGKARWVRN